MHGQRRLPVLEGGEVLRLRHGNGGVALDDALDQAAHGLKAEREWRHVEQQDLAVLAIAGQLVGLDGGAQGHDFIGIQIGQHPGFAIRAEQMAHGHANARHAGGAADHHGALHFIDLDLGIAQYALHGGERA